MMPAIDKRVSATLRFLKKYIYFTPATGIILGSGFGDFAGLIKDKKVIPFRKIINFPTPTAKGHEGNLIIGKIENKRVIVMQGRVHHYEGYSISEVAFPVRIMAGLGVKTLIVTTSVGGINKRFSKGSIMIIKDHINLMFENPLRSEFREPFIDMSSAYDTRLQNIAVKTGKGIGQFLFKGILAALPGPSYETPAEIRMLQRLGADAVCMSAIPEVIMARYLKLRVLGIALISNMAAGISPNPLSHAEVVQTGKEKIKEVACLIKGIVKEI